MLTAPPASHSDEDDATVSVSVQGEYLIHAHTRRLPVEDEEEVENEDSDDTLVIVDSELKEEDDRLCNELDVFGLELEKEEFNELVDDELELWLLDVDELELDLLEELE